MRRRVLFISNGIGEDMIAARIAASLPDRLVTVAAYPLVGLGVYPPSFVLLDPRRELPSAGFSLRSGWRGLPADLAAGLVGLWRAQYRTLRAQRGQWDLVVAVGDVYCLRMASLAAPRAAFVATAESVRIAPFGWVARQVMRRRALRIFARDPDSASFLAAHGLPAVAPGNVMMDLVSPTGETFDLEPDVPVVALLPGSRRDAPHNAVLLARAAAAIADRARDVRFLLAVAPTVSESALRERLCGLGYVATSADGDLTLGRARTKLTRAFADAVARAWVILGMAGTAHEQAAGLGRPVVAFPGHSAQFGRAFLGMQHRLLGDALVPTRHWGEAAAAVVRLLHDPAERERRGAVGRQRMGPPGGAQHIADELTELLSADLTGIRRPVGRSR